MLRARREASSIDLAAVAKAFERDIYGTRFSASLLSSIELEHIRLPRGFIAEYMAALELAPQYM